MADDARDVRLHAHDRAPDDRSAAERDRDRVLASAAFRRLAGVTQVVTPSESHIFHNRLTHTVQVAQVGRRLAQHVLRRQPDLAQTLGGVDPDVVEAAGLAHDLGHPPFGHVAEAELDRLLTGAGLRDGFEGNAQSFRIVTRLAVRREQFPGLNLTRATLNAMLKYPWTRQPVGLAARKWGAYDGEVDELTWTRAGRGERRTVEAELMDWADDVTNAVHDVEDLYRAGLIPLDRLTSDAREFERLLRGIEERWRASGRDFGADEYRSAVDVIRSVPLTERYAGTFRQEATLQELTSSLITRYLSGLELRLPPHPAAVVVAAELEREIDLWKELTWHYVIASPAVATQRHGQRRVIRDLFTIFGDAASGREWSVFPAAYRERLQAVDGDARATLRTIGDLVASLTDRSALDLHQRLTGVSLGSVFDVVGRLP